MELADNCMHSQVTAVLTVCMTVIKREIDRIIRDTIIVITFGPC